MELPLCHSKSDDDIVKRDKISASYVGDVMKLAFLSPKLIQDIVHGRQSERQMVSQLTKVDTIPMRWEEQEETYACEQ